MVLVKPGARFDRIAPAGYLILSALRRIADTVDHDLLITSGTDDAHSGPGDPHHLGEAYDVRSHDLTAEQKAAVLRALQTLLGSRRFYFFLEGAGTVSEHFHIQRRKDTTFTIADLLAWTGPIASYPPVRFVS